MARKEKQPPPPKALVETPELVFTPPIKIRTLPNGDMDPVNAAKYVHRAVHTLAQWRSERRGPAYKKVNGRIFYTQPALDRHLDGVPVTPELMREPD